MENQLTKLYNAVSAPVAATRDALTERLQGIRETASLLYNRMMENMGYGPERLKDIVEKEAEEEQQQEEDWREDPWLLKFVPDHFKTQEMCLKAFEVGLWQLKDVSDHFKTQEMCDDAVRRSLFYLKYVPDCFVTQGQVKLWHDDYYYYYDDWLINWYHDYQKRKAQKAKIKEELMPIAWHSDRVMDWCMSGDEKRWRK